MILPIYAYGMPVLKKPATPIEQDYFQLQELIENMWETMYNAKGVGLAAPQIGLGIRLFIVDTVQLENEDRSFRGIKKVFINPQKIEETGEEWTYEEGCLSIPKVTGDVLRYERIYLRYYDQDFNEVVQEFDDMNARVIQHEYDHLEGVLFLDRLKPLKRRLLTRKLDQIKKGKIDADYRMKFKQ